MTENLFLKVEEKVMTLVTELEDLRKEMNRVRQENLQLKADKTNHGQKLQGLISLLEAIDVIHEPRPIHEHVFSHARAEEVAAV